MAWNEMKTPLILISDDDDDHDDADVDDDDHDDDHDDDAEKQFLAGISDGAGSWVG